MENKEIFTIDFFKALSNWQNGWSEKQEKRRLIADELLKQCEKMMDNKINQQTKKHWNKLNELLKK